MISINKNFKRLLIGWTFSNLGSWFRTIAVISFIYEMTGSPMAVGISFLLRFFPRVLMTFLSGAIIDQIPKKFILVYANYLAFLFGFTLFALLSYQFTNLYVFYTLIFLISVADAIYQPARMAAIPELIDNKDYYGKAVAHMRISRELTMVFSTGVGGLLMGLVGINIIFLIDSITYLIAGSIQRTIKLESKGDKSSIKSKLKGSFNQIKEGLEILTREKSVQLVTAIFSVRQFTYGIANIAFAIVIYEKFGLGDNWLAWSYMVGGIGAMIGGIIVHKIIKSKLKEQSSAITFVILANSINAILLTAMFISPSIWVFLVMVMLHDIAMLCTEVFLEGSILTFVKKEVTGRASSLFLTSGEVSFLLGSIIYTFVISSWSFEALGAMFLIVMLGGTFLIGLVSRRQEMAKKYIQEGCDENI